MAYASLYEMWRRVDDGVSYDIVLDLGYAEDFPLSEAPWFFGVRIPMADADEHGMPTPTEHQRLNLVENRIRELLRSRDGIYVGRATGARNRDLLFYLGERPSGLDDRIRASCGMEILFISRKDRDWQGYLSLLPQPREWRQIEDQKTIDALVELGTNPDHTHEVIHTVVTSSTKGAEALLKLYQKLELVDCASTGVRPEITVTGVQRTQLILDDIHRVAWILDSKAPKARGEYLNWTAEPQLFDEGEAQPEDFDAALEVKSILEALSTGVDL